MLRSVAISSNYSFSLFSRQHVVTVLLLLQVLWEPFCFYYSILVTGSSEGDSADPKTTNAHRSRSYYTCLLLERLKFTLDVSAFAYLLCTLVFDIQVAYNMLRPLAATFYTVHASEHTSYRLCLLISNQVQVKELVQCAPKIGHNKLVMLSKLVTYLEKE